MKIFLQSKILSKALAFVAILFSMNFSFSQSPETFTTSGNWVVPCGVTSVTVEAWGGGGAGGGGASTSQPGGSGGGSGSYVTNTFAVTAGSTINYVIGTGGAGGTGTGDSGTATNWNGGAMIANGGTGGNTNGGAAGSGQGGSGGTVTDGVTGVTGSGTVGGAGGSSPNGGAGGAGGTQGNNGVDGNSPGAGGGGGGRRSGGSESGGDGADGQITITYTIVLPTAPIAGSNQTLTACATSTTLAGNTPDAGTTGTWTVSPAGPVITDANNPLSGVTGLIPGTSYTFTWSFVTAGCTTQTSTVTVDAISGPGCNVYCTPATTLGTTYSITDVSFSDLSNSSSESTLPMFQDNTGMCAGVSPSSAYNLCVSGTTGAAGVNVTAYFDWNNDGDFVDAGETITVGSAPTGNWGPLCTSVTVPAGATIGSTVMRIMAIRDSEAQGPCLTTIAFGETEDYCVNICETTVPNAGADQVLALCDTDATMAGNTITFGTGTWTVFSGSGTITDPSSPTTTITSLGEGDNIFAWTVTDAPCPDLVSYVTITTSGPLTVNAGVDLITCSSSIALSGSDPAGDVGLWTVVGGPAGSSFTDSSSATTSINGLVDGIYTLQWSVTNACGPYIDLMTLTVGSTLPAANAGPDQTGVCPFSAVMAAEDVTGLTGVWSFVSGPNTAGISDPTSSSTSVVDLSATAGTYVFRWTISGGGCVGSSFDDVSISMSNCTNTLTHSVTSDQTVTGCNFTYTDDGGAGGDYTDGALLTSTTICPDSPDQYVTIDFTSLDLGGYIYDNLVIFDQANDAAPMVGYADGAGEAQLLNPASGDPIVSSSVWGSVGGCLTIQFTSHDINTSTLDIGSGWIATTGCTTVQGTPITDYISGTNCGGNGGITLCNATSNISPDTQFQGGQMDLTVGAVGGIATPGGNNGCMGSGESNEQWVYFNIVNDGYVQFTFDAAGGQDFDWAIWGPYGGASCPLNTGDSPIRCSWATSGQNSCTGTHLTGLAFTVPAAVDPPMAGLSTAGDFSEEGNGCVDDGNGYNDGFVEPIYAYAGEVYTMLINNYSNNNSSYTFDYITDGQEAGLGCDPPVVLGAELMDFTGVAHSRYNELVWKTVTEENNDYFMLEGSTNNHVWKDLGKVKGSGNSTTEQSYSFEDYIMTNPITYYRLRQVDYDGKATHSQVIAVVREIEINDIVSNIYPNPSSGEFYFNYGGVDYKTAVTVEVINTFGQTVLREEYNKFNKHVAMSFDGSELSEGLYQVKITQGDAFEVQKISVVK